MQNFTIEDAIQLGNRGEAAIESIHWPASRTHIKGKLAEHVSSQSSRESITIYLNTGTWGGSAKKLLQAHVQTWLSGLGFKVSFPSLLQVQIDWSGAPLLELDQKVLGGEWQWDGTWQTLDDKEDTLEPHQVVLHHSTETISLGFSARSIKTAQYLVNMGEQRVRFEMLHSRCVDAIKQSISRGLASCKFSPKPTINGKVVNIRPLFKQLAAKLRAAGFSVLQNDISLTLEISGWNSSSGSGETDSFVDSVKSRPPTSLLSAVAAAADYTLRRSLSALQPHESGSSSTTSTTTSTTTSATTNATTSSSTNTSFSSFSSPSSSSLSSPASFSSGSPFPSSSAISSKSDSKSGSKGPTISSSSSSSSFMRQPDRSPLLDHFVNLLFEYWTCSQREQPVPVDLWQKLKQAEANLLSLLKS